MLKDRRRGGKCHDFPVSVKPKNFFNRRISFNPKTFLNPKKFFKPRNFFEPRIISKILKRGEDGIIIWNWKFGEKLTFLRNIKSSIWSLTKIGRIIFAGAENGQILRFDLDLEISKNCSNIVHIDESNPRIATVLRVGNLCYLLSENGTVYILYIEKGNDRQLGLN